MYAIYSLIIIFLILIFYQIINFYNIKEGATSKQKMSDKPDVVTGSNINKSISPIKSDITDFYNGLSTDLYAPFKRLNYTYQDLTDGYDRILKNLGPEKQKVFLKLSDSIIDWFIKWGSFLTGDKLYTLIEFTSDEISKVIAGTNGTQIKNILNTDNTLEKNKKIIKNLIALPILPDINYYILSTNLNDDCLDKFTDLNQEYQKYALEKLKPDEIREVLLIPSNYVVAMYLMYNKNASRTDLTNLLASINGKQQSIETNIGLSTKCEADNNILDHQILNCKINKSAATDANDKYKATIDSQKQTLGIIQPLINKNR